MELMSSLLLCALAALPQALGSKGDIKRDGSIMFETPISRKTVWLSAKIPSTVSLDMVLQSMLMDKGCSVCINCMIHSIYSISSKKGSRTAPKYTSHTGIQNDIIENYHQYKMIRRKRGAETKSANATKTQVSKSRNVTVTKYNMDGQIYAIKMREKNSTEESDQNETCQVYSVKKYYPCHSAKADSIFTIAKRRASQRSKKQTKNIVSTSKPQSTEPQPHFASRGKVLTEPFMTSTEELYN